MELVEHRSGERVHLRSRPPWGLWTVATAAFAGIGAAALIFGAPDALERGGMDLVGLAIGVAVLLAGAAGVGGYWGWRRWWSLVVDVKEGVAATNGWVEWSALPDAIRRGQLRCMPLPRRVWQARRLTVLEVRLVLRHPQLEHRELERRAFYFETDRWGPHHDEVLSALEGVLEEMGVFKDG